MAAGGGTGSISIAPGSKNQEGETPTDAYPSASPDPRPSLPHPRAGEDREGARRARRDALACRRSTAALAAANQRRRSASERASWDAADIRRYLKRACPSPASFSQTGHGAGRAFSRSRPGLAIVRQRRLIVVIYQCIIEAIDRVFIAGKYIGSTPVMLFRKEKCFPETKTTNLAGCGVTGLMTALQSAPQTESS